MIFSKKAGTKKRFQKVERDPVERQARVREALEAAVGSSGDDDDSDMSPVPVSPDGKKWWQQRFQALFLPNIRFEDGGIGFVQVGGCW